MKFEPPPPHTPQRWLQAIPTRYRTITFRSRLEASVAQLLDATAVPWAYEQESFQLGAERYLPDFWLPQAQQFLEVKGLVGDPSVEKCILLAQAFRGSARQQSVGGGRDVDPSVVLPDEEECARPAAVVVLSSPFVRASTPGNEVFGFGFNGVEQVDALLVSCPHCRVTFFMTAVAGWTCSACGRWGKHERVLVSAEHRHGKTTYERVA